MAAGSTSPNPPVGAVIVSPSGEVVGEGYTQPAGGAHAEVMALKDAGSAARGGRAIVTLEPCNHQGRTGPCSQALLAAGVSRVDFLFADPSPVACGGAETLRNAGVDVHGPFLPSPSHVKPWTPLFSVEPWLRSMALGRPHVTVKVASTADGRIAARDGSSQWITGAAARRVVHVDRSRRDAIVVGTGTAIADNPSLTARREDGSLLPNQPLRVLMGERGLPADTALFTGDAPAMHVRSRDPHAVLAQLSEHGVVDVLIEGGAGVIGSFIHAGLVDAVQLYMAPALLGGGSAWIDSPQLGGSMDDIRRFTPRELTTAGDDVIWRLTAPI
ncbi:MAG TPA: bifunctional diaminohydroxyphosphoribosylaminopyrimidine deaminase/5-amino-6-(5-phosphoribosylamino)uracil reductase RibD [Candidatus Corynebacterium gallistercoris]|uniref:Riboflavin biosynthesis protein RibD n=1 Tax=Candidatus Corynebacterium gallistercoris TaxID=2838530 RepID=A0A9D1RZH6_9CORY|nr:bifunctional diaminohydroxyphosphoribosylaminopyrimidine deaminase/5-amino-6-(5-phosphoribosylamino)uracil reductase RibD [Candidatus Corynebacterium gallistercoris]